MIEARHLSKHDGETLAVDNLSFTLAAGQVTGFLAGAQCLDRLTTPTVDGT